VDLSPSLLPSLRNPRLRGCISFLPTKKAAAFTLVELLVVIGIVVLLLSVFIPYFSSIVEASNRTQCAENLRKIGFALSEYARSHDGQFPRVRYDAEANPHGYTAFTGPDAADPFVDGGGVSPNDVTASLWLLVRNGYITSDYSPVSAVFICPSTADTSDPITGGNAISARQRSNFRMPSNLSYSYASPFSNATGYGMIDFYLKPQFAILADRNPGIGRGSDVTGPSHSATELQMAQANSRNHNRAGQNVLFADMHAEFKSTPYCGVDDDNIYTTLAPTPIFSETSPALNSNGYCAPNSGPAWQTDTYLVPTAQDAL
jgi:type II secretory pathway pseudopilin PulG